ncbi:MAG: hypothetical protein IIC31_08515, partial [Chloroflexi bacterium]|nr:hypothetical protein [Chloroflexota bacterium]
MADQPSPTTLDDVRDAALAALEAAADAPALEAWRVAHLGRSGALTQLLRGVAALPAEERPAAGAAGNAVKALLDGALPAIAVIVLVLSVLATSWIKLARPSWAEKGVMHDMFHVGPVWFGMRILGAAFALMTFFQFGPEFVTASFTGGVMLNDLAPVLLTFFFFAALLLPFLVEFGFMEFIGSLVRKPFRVIFNLPGRSAIDATASWMGSGTVGVLITTQQYEKGFYNRREASVIATNFSIVSIAFSLLITSFVDLNHMFIQFYFTVVVAGLIAAVIVPRLPPLSRKPDTYYEPVGCQLAEKRTEEMGLLRYSLTQAVRRAERSPGPRELARNALFNVADIFLALLPLVFAIGTVALILAEFTPLFTWLSYPMVPVLELLRIPEAQAAAPATLVGFADMFLPAHRKNVLPWISVAGMAGVLVFTVFFLLHKEAASLYQGIVVVD